jgi:hypothetical protein
MPVTKRPQRYSSAAIAHLDELLDDAPKATFPASDPIAINFELGVTRARNRPTIEFHTPLSGPGKPRQAQVSRASPGRPS